MNRRFVIIIIGVFVVGGAAVLFFPSIKRFPFRPTETQLPVVSQPVVEEEIVAENLEIPWEIAFLPNGEFLVTERPGRLLKIGATRAVIPIDGVRHTGEGWLLGMALHPFFENNQWVYLYLTTKTENGLRNRVERYRLVGDHVEDRTVILDNIPGASFHDGGRIAFGPDGLLYITTGDASVPGNAQDKRSLAGKILRVRDDGSIPDNPFGTAVYSYGHRNPQGLAWDSEGRLWATEHGRSGVQSGLDELNLVEPGANYGWPVIQGDEERAWMRRPVIHSGSDETWAPSGAIMERDRIWFAGLRGEALYEAVLDGKQVKELKVHLREKYGRLRTVRVGSDGYFYLLTSNRDGRGTVREGDDKIIRVHPRVLGL